MQLFIHSFFPLITVNSETISKNLSNHDLRKFLTIRGCFFQTTLLNKKSQKLKTASHPFYKRLNLQQSRRISMF